MFKVTAGGIVKSCNAESDDGDLDAKRFTVLYRVLAPRSHQPGNRGYGVCRGLSFPRVARTPGSWLRELMASLVKTLCRWYSTVRGLMNSWAAISGLDRPSPASQAIWVSRAVSWAGASVVRLRTRSPVARSSRAARSANPSAPMEANIW